ncbi:MAG: hypothetical protein EXR68_03385 [Dehalococcoidia bacterium]|nr:hypothetical protein [Dehalococcoidia bacterium]
MQYVSNGAGPAIDGAGLPPPLGSRVLIVSSGLERSYDRARVLEQLGYRFISCGDPFELRALLADHLPEAVVIDLMREGVLRWPRQRPLSAHAQPRRSSSWARPARSPR